MKKIIIGGLAAGAVALGIAVAGPAYADSDNSVYGGGYFGDQSGYHYAVQLDGYGAAYTVADATEFGLSTCHGLRSGVAEAAEINSGSSLGIPLWQATLAIHGAEFHFCPDEY